MQKYSDLGGLGKWVVWVLVAVIIGSVGVMVSKDRYNQSIRWQLWCENEDSRTVRLPVTWASLGRDVRWARQRVWDMLPHAPKCEPIAKGKTMAIWEASGAGDASYDGDYSQVGGETFNGQPVYRLDANPTGKALFLSDGTNWSLATDAIHGAGPMAYGYGSSLPGTPTVDAGTAPAPVLAEQGAWVRIGSDEADAALWDDASQHRQSKWSGYGGYKDVDADTSGAALAALPFQFQAPEFGTGGAGNYQVTLKLGGHSWCYKLEAGSDEVQSSSIGPANWVYHNYGGDSALPQCPWTRDESGNFVPNASWDEWLGSAGEKTITLELCESGSETVLASDTAAFTMFVPLLSIVTDPASTVPDVFEATLAVDECYHDAEGYKSALLGATGSLGLPPAEYQFSPVLEPAIVLELPAAAETDLALMDAGAYSDEDGLSEGNFLLVARPYQAGPLDLAYLTLSHVQAYELAITSPATGAELLSGSRAAMVHCSQGWKYGSQLRLFVERGGVWVYVGTATQSARFVPVTGALLAGDTGLKVEWAYQSGLDWIVLASDTVAITVADDGGITGGGGGEGGGMGEGFPPVPYPENPPGEEGGGGTVYPPWVQWAFPAFGVVMDGTFTAYLPYGNTTPTATGHLKIVAMGAAATLTLYDEDVVLGATGTLIVPLELTGPPADGDYTCYVTLTGIAGEMASTSSLVTMEAAGGDTTVPTCSILSPATGASAAATVTVVVAAADEVAVWRVAVVIDGVAQYLFAPNSGVNYSFTLNLRRMANGPHTVSAVAMDTSGNVSETATITLMVNNALADAVRIVRTEQLGTDADNVPLNQASIDGHFGGTFLEAIEVLEPQVLPTDPNLLYNLQVGYNVPGLSEDWVDFTVVAQPGYEHPVAPTGRTIRWMLRATPQQVLSYWDLTAEAILRLTLAEDGNVLALATGPDAVHKLNVATGAVTTWRYLAGWATETPVDLVAVDGKVIVAAGAELVVFDVDAADETLMIRLAADVEAITALAQSNGTVVIAADLLGGGSRLYSYTYPSLREITTHSQSITALAVIAGVLLAGDATGDIYTVTTTMAQEYSSGEAVVRRFGDGGGVRYAGTGSAGKVASDVDGWEIEADLPWTETRGLATLNGWMWVGGNGSGGGHLWQEGNDGWVQALELADVTGVNDLLAVTSDERNQLLVASENGGATSRLYRVEISAAGALQMGEDFPAFSGRITRSLV